MGDAPHNTTDDVSRDTTVDVTTAAQILGISEEAVRARIRRGKLRAEKVGALWRIHLDRGTPAEIPTRDSIDTTPDEVSRDTTQQTSSDQTRRDVAQHNTAPVDLAPLAEVIEAQTKQISELSAAVGMWQARAHHLEAQVKQLTATIEHTNEAAESPERVEPDNQDVGDDATETDAQRGAGGLWRWLSRWLGGGQR